MNQELDNNFLRRNKGVELGFMVVGVALFIVLGARGLKKIGDMQVAAGERQKAIVQFPNHSTEEISPKFGALLAASSTVDQPNVKHSNDLGPQTVKRSSNNKPDISQSDIKEPLTDNTLKSLKKLDIGS